MYTEVEKWIKAQGIAVSKNWLKLRMQSHPDYPSLTAVQDTLEELGIEAYACTGTKEELRKENKPFLAHLNQYGGNIVFCQSVVAAEKKVKNFDEVWSGHVMLMEKTERKTFGNAEHNALLKKEKQNFIFTTLTIGLVVGIAIILLIIDNNIIAMPFLITAITGIFISWLITQKELGISNSLSDKICSMAKHSRCEAVFNSKGAKLFNWLTWGDVGMVYFSASFLFICVNQLTNTPNYFYYYFAVAGLVFPIYSLYYQWKVIKQWCMLCIGILVLLAINAGIGAFQITGIKEPLSFSTAFWTGASVFSIISLVLLMSWQLLKSLYQRSLSALQNEIKATKLKRNPQLFNAVLDKEVLNPLNMPQAAEALRFGSPAAPYQLLIACNPNCGPCAKAHHAIEALYERYKHKIAVTIRFALNSADEVADKRTAAASHILKAAIQKPYEAVKDWYSNMDLEQFKKQHQVNACLPDREGEDVTKYIHQHIQWAKAVEITATPTVFVNGRKLPDLYNWADLVPVLDYALK
ncbi:MAG: hypothetical protein RL115_473 [Bacteroidota bacterium]